METFVIFRTVVPKNPAIHLEPKMDLTDEEIEAKMKMYEALFGLNSSSSEDLNG